MLLTDARLVSMLASAPDEIALKAADLTSKLLGRYADAGITIDLRGRADAVLAADLPMPPDELGTV